MTSSVTHHLFTSSSFFHHQFWSMFSRAQKLHIIHPFLLDWWFETSNLLFFEKRVLECTHCKAFFRFRLQRFCFHHPRLHDLRHRLGKPFQAFWMHKAALISMHGNDFGRCIIKCPSSRWTPTPSPSWTTCSCSSVSPAFSSTASCHSGQSSPITTPTELQTLSTAFWW